MPLASQEVGPLPALQATAMLGLCPLHCAPSAGGRRAGDREEPVSPLGAWKPGCSVPLGHL